MGDASPQRPTLEVRWSSLFADVPDDETDSAVDFWAAVTGGRPGEPRGDRREFVPIGSDDRDPVLWIQRQDLGPPGWHLDLHVSGLVAETQLASELGALVRHAAGDVVGLQSPAGIPFCFVREPDGHAHRRPRPATTPGGVRSLVDQICLDIPSASFDEEGDFWSRLTGWPREGSDAPEFDRLTVPKDLPLRILLQRVDDRPGAHADLACSDRPAEVARHEQLGARVVRECDSWTVLDAPGGSVYCITDRKPRR